MKKLIFLFVVFFSLNAYGQEFVSSSEAVDILTNNLKVEKQRITPSSAGKITTSHSTSDNLQLGKVYSLHFLRDAVQTQEPSVAVVEEVFNHPRLKFLNLQDKAKLEIKSYLIELLEK